MRRYLPSQLRKRFDTAWRMLPDPIKEQVRHFIHAVRAADSIKDVQVRCTDGTIRRSSQEAGGKNGLSDKWSES